MGFDLANEGNNSLAGSLGFDNVSGTPNQASGGFFGLVSEGFNLIRQGNEVYRDISAPERVYEQRVVPDTDVLQEQRQNAIAKGPNWLMPVAILAAGLVLLLIVKD